MEKMLLNIFVLIQQVLFRSIVQSDRHGSRNILQNSISSASAKAAASVVAPIAAIAAAWGNFGSIFKRVADASMCLLTQPTKMATSVELLQCLRSEYVG